MKAVTHIPAWVPASVPEEDRSAFKSTGQELPCLRGLSRKARCENQNPSLVLRSWNMEDGRECLSYFCKICGEKASSAVKQTPSAMSRAREQKAADLNLTPTSPAFDKESPERTIARLQTWQRTYADYLGSPEWAKKRQEVLRRDSAICCVCGRTANRVHHLTYEHVDFRGGEPLSDLVSVCDRCHKAIHDLNPIERHFRQYGWWSKANWFTPQVAE